MTLLVIGKSGQLSQALQQQAARQGRRLIAVGRPSVDVMHVDSLRAAVTAHQPTVVVNTAAYTAVDQAQSESKAAFALNRDGAANLARVCSEMDVPLIHISTDYVFDGRLKRAYREDDGATPLNVYGASKLAGEQKISELAPRHLILRTSWIFSPFGSNFARTMLRAGQQRRDLRVVGDQLGRPTYAVHLADAILQLAAKIEMRTSDAFSWGTYHVAGEGTASWYDLAWQIFDVAQRHGGPRVRLENIATKQYPTPALRPMNSTLDCWKLEQTFGLRLPNWRTGVTACVKELSVDA
jgi:dTDP-4-dehydrorhamnose reductase